MNLLESFVEKAKKTYPDILIEYKDKSFLMKIFGILLFFNKDFMNKYTTTIGSTVYFPNRESVDKSPIRYSMVFLHELIHIHDRKNNILFPLLYLFPQILALIFIPLAIFVNWWFILLVIIFLLPLPAYFRMIYEKRAYTITLYVHHKLAKKLGYTSELYKDADFIVPQFTGPAYMFMWPFSSVKKYFYSVCDDLMADRRPPFVEDAVYNLIDSILED